jgi:putative intracellular protease/amidase
MAVVAAWRTSIMFVRYSIWGGLALFTLLLVGFGTWVISLPPAPAAIEAAPVAQGEMDAMRASLRPTKRGRPLIAIVGINDATETTDYLMPTGILRRADVADVVMLATSPGRVELYPALTVDPDATLAEFETGNADGADYIIVPAMSRDDDPAVAAFLRSQAAKGAIIISVCAGAKGVAAAGLLNGKRATTHWYYLKEMLERHPSINYVADRRMVVDQSVATTTGITASMPMMLTLIEAIAGHGKAEAVARDLGLPVWDARHASDAFKFTRPFALTVLGNLLAFWNHEEVGVELRPGMDEVSLALVADAWSRTYRSKAVTFAALTGVVETRNGVRVVPDVVAPHWPGPTRIPDVFDRKPADALGQTLLDLSARYGERTTAAVAMQLEYPRR